MVIFWGTWRVNGQLAVSRAIGSYIEKIYLGLLLVLQAILTTNHM